MSQPLPDTTPSEDELNECIRHFGKPSGQELEKSLKQRLEQTKQRYLKRQYDLLDREERTQNQDRNR